jgi:hypothetical protein
MPVKNLRITTESDLLANSLDKDCSQAFVITEDMKG